MLFYPYATLEEYQQAQRVAEKKENKPTSSLKTQQKETSDMTTDKRPQLLQRVVKAIKLRF